MKKQLEQRAEEQKKLARAYRMANHLATIQYLERQGWKFTDASIIHPHNGDRVEDLKFQSPRMNRPCSYNVGENFFKAEASFLAREHIEYATASAKSKAFYELTNYFLENRDATCGPIFEFVVPNTTL